MLAGLINNMIGKMGVSCRIYDPENREIGTAFAIIEPLRYKYRDFGYDQRINGGLDERYYLCFTDAGHDLSRLPLGSCIESGDKRFRTDTSEMYYCGGAALYCRSVLKLIGGGENDDGNA